MWRSAQLELGGLSARPLAAGEGRLGDTGSLAAVPLVLSGKVGFRVTFLVAPAPSVSFAFRPHHHSALAPLAVATSLPVARSARAFDPEPQACEVLDDRHLRERGGRPP